MKLISALMLIQSMLSLERKRRCNGESCSHDKEEDVKPNEESTPMKKRLHRKVTFLRKRREC